MNFMELAEKYSRGEIAPNAPELAEVQEYLAELASTDEGLREIAETIAVYIDTTFHKFDISPYLFNNKPFKLGDKPEFRLKKKGIKAYWIAPNSYTPKSRNYQETLSMEFDSLSVRPECLIDELTAGRIDTLADLINDAREAMANAVIAKVFTILAQVYNEVANPNNFDECTTTLAEQSLKDAIDYVFYKTGVRPTVMGDMMLTNQIMDFNTFTEETKEEIRKTGKIGVYRGATILSLQEVLDPATKKPLVPKNRLYVVSSKIGYSGTYGNSKFGQETNLDDWTWNARIDKEWGATVTEPDGLYVIEVN